MGQNGKSLETEKLAVNEGTAASSVVAKAATQQRVDSPTARAWRRFRRHHLAIISSLLLSVIILSTLAAPVLAPRGPVVFDYRVRYSPPNSDYLMGTDALGRDVFARVLYGGRVSLSVGLVITGVSFTIGITLGALSGYVGGTLDLLFQRLMEVVNSTPQLILVISFVAILKDPNIYITMTILGLLGWTGVYRFVRGQVLSLREEDYVLAARALGARTGHTIIRHILPGVLPYLIVQLAFTLPGAILTETSLSFLGLGVQEPTPSWGNVVGTVRAMENLQNRVWMWLPAGLMITLTVLCINFLGDALRDAIDPHVLIGK